MLTYQQVKDLEPRLCAEAGQAWKDWANQLDQHTHQVRKQVIDLVFEGDVWDDSAADAGRDYMEGLMRGMGLSYDDVDAVGAELETFAREAGNAQHKLNRNEQRALDGDLNVDQHGAITLPEEKKDDAKLQELAFECALGIMTARDDATAADRRLAQKLGEYDQRIPTLHQLNAESDRLEKQAEKAGKEAKRLLEEGVDNLSRQELRRLIELMGHTGDPAYAAEFAEEVGPKGMLELSLLAARASEAGHPELARKLQQELGQILATATDKTNGQHVSYESHTPQERHDKSSWMEKLKQAGRERIGTDSNDPAGRDPGSSRPITGYHALAALLDDSDYSTGFLLEVGNDMYRFDVTENPEAWTDAPLAGRLDLDLNDPHGYGLDPMSGLMEGLANNPEAAQEFFNQGFEDLKGENAQKPLHYLLAERDWGDENHAAGTNNLGRALEAATTTTRNPAAAQIVGETVHQLGSTPGVTLPANMRDSLGHMLGTWIGDVNQSVEGWPEGSREGWRVDTSMPEMPWQKVHAYFNRDEVFEVMGEAAKDPDAWHEMWNKQRIFTTIALDQVAPDGAGENSNFHTTAESSAKVFGALVKARAEALGEDAQQSVASIEAGRVAAGWTVGAATSAAGTVVGGPAGAATGYLGLAGGQFVVNEVAEKLKGQATADDYERVEATYANGERAVKNIIEATAWRNEAYGEVPPVIHRSNGDRIEYWNGEPVRLVDSNGNPIPYAEMNAGQREAYRTWLMQQPAYGDLNNAIAVQYGDGVQKMGNASISGSSGGS